MISSGPWAVNRKINGTPQRGCVCVCVSVRSLVAFEEAAANCTGGNCWPVKKLPISSQSGRSYCIKGCNGTGGLPSAFFKPSLFYTHTHTVRTTMTNVSFWTVDGLPLAYTGPALHLLIMFACVFMPLKLTLCCDVLNIFVMNLMNSADLNQVWVFFF